MAQGNYDHPAYVSRGVLNFVNTAGTTNQSAQLTLPWAAKVHSLTAVVKTAGASATGKVALMNGTTTVGSLTTGTATASSVFTSATDINYTVPVNGVLALIGVGDAQVVASVNVEYNILPTATWLGTE